jgi:hypothetical protein
LKGIEYIILEGKTINIKQKAKTNIGANTFFFGILFEEDITQ